MKKIKVAVLFGGKSAEHEVSLLSARNVIAALDPAQYDPFRIGIDKAGAWRLYEGEECFLDADDPKRIHLASAGISVALPPGSRDLVDLSCGASRGRVDVAFPVLHGTCGEDGTVQGLLQLAGVPFVGAGVAGSAIGMDKDVMKRLLKEAGLPGPRFIVFSSPSSALAGAGRVEQELGLPAFVKPANLGSSVGISKARTEEDYARAVREAFRFDRKILVEEAISGREIECAVLGNEDPIASVPGEIIPQGDFYSYDAKYIDDHGAVLSAPAQLGPAVVKAVQDLAIQAFKVLCCEGLARVDFFLKPDGQILVNEINTIPGFTKISMYPRLWELSGIPYAKLIDRLIRLALERAEKESAIESSRGA